MIGETGLAMDSAWMRVSLRSSVNADFRDGKFGDSSG